MQRFRFRLQRLMDLTAKQEKALEQELAVFAMEEERLSRELSAAQAEYTAYCDRMTIKQAEGLTSWEWGLHAGYLLAFRQHLGVLEQALREARKQLEEARGRLLQKRRERKALEALCRRELERYWAAVRAEEGRETDEVVTAVTARQRSGMTSGGR